MVGISWSVIQLPLKFAIHRKLDGKRNSGHGLGVRKFVLRDVARGKWGIADAGRRGTKDTESIDVEYPSLAPAQNAGAKMLSCHS